MAQQASRMTPPLERIFTRRLGLTGMGFQSPKTPKLARQQFWQESRVASGRPGFLTPKLDGSSPMIQRKRFLSARSGSPSGLSPGLQSPSKFFSPRKESGDRFIPARSRLNVDRSNYLILNKTSPRNALTSNSLALPEIKIFTFSNESPNHPESQDAVRMEGAFTKLKEFSSPTKVLDAPNITLDYTLNVMDWSCTSQVALALNDTVYLWNSETLETKILCQTPEFCHVTSVRWNSRGDVLAVADSEGRLNCWMKSNNKTFVCLNGDKIFSLAWNDEAICSGDSTGSIYHHDIKTGQPSFLRVKGHLGSVICLDWSSTGCFLASGCTQGVVKIWSANDVTRALHVLTKELSSMRALTWCPWLSSVFAMGILSSNLCVWKIGETPMKVVEAKSDSKVTDMKWSPNTKEIVTSHFNGYMNIWSYPALKIIRRLKGHDGGVVTLSLSPDLSSLASVGVDETLRIWSCFPKKVMSKAKTNSITRTCLR